MMGRSEELIQMGRKERKIVRKADEKEIHKLMKTETVPKHGSDEKLSMNKLTEPPSTPWKPPRKA
jgi:hypothetical protein